MKKKADVPFDAEKRHISTVPVATVQFREITDEEEDNASTISFSGFSRASLKAMCTGSSVPAKSVSTREGLTRLTGWKKAIWSVSRP